MHMNNTTSNTIRLNITLPSDIGQKVKAAKNSSALIAESLRQKFARDDKALLDATLGKAYADAAAEDRKIARDWDVTIDDGLE